MQLKRELHPFFDGIFPKKRLSLFEGRGGRRGKSENAGKIVDKNREKRYDIEL